MTFLEFYREQRQTLPIVPTSDDVKGRTYIVTGANTGLGRECVKHLIRLGALRVVLAVRTVPRGEAALTAIEEDLGIRGVGEVWPLDLRSFESVEAFAKRVDGLDRLDSLIANASEALSVREIAEGLEASLMSNVVGTMLLGVRSLPKLRDTARRLGGQTRLAIVVSGAGFLHSKPGFLEEIRSNIFETLSAEDTDMENRYPLTKLLQIYSIRELASRLPVSETGVVIDMVSPGLCVTELDRNAGLWFRLNLAIMRLVLGRTAEEGSRTLLHAGFAAPECHGRYLASCQDQEGVIPQWVSGPVGSETQKRVWRDLLDTLEKKGHTLNLP